MEPTTTGSPSLRPNEYLVSLDGLQVRVFCPPTGPIEVDGQEVEARLSIQPNGSGVLELDGRQFRVIFEPSEKGGREFSAQLKGRWVGGTVDDKRSLLRQKVGQEESLTSAPMTIKAPMPGLVTKLLVKMGQDVAKGEGLLVLEAMKMENEVKADRPGIIDAIMVTERCPVEKGQPMVSLKPKP